MNKIEDVDISKIVFVSIPNEETYRISLLNEALEMRQDHSDAGLTRREINTIINTAATN